MAIACQCRAVHLNLDFIPAVSWTWRALRGHSVTFASLFALGLLGFSLLGEFRGVLARLGAPWYAWFVVPIVGIAFLAKKEQEWIPDPVRRRRWARGIFFGAIALSIAIAKFG